MTIVFSDTEIVFVFIVTVSVLAFVFSTKVPIQPLTWIPTTEKSLKIRIRASVYLFVRPLRAVLLPVAQPARGNRYAGRAPEHVWRDSRYFLFTIFLKKKKTGISDYGCMNYAFDI